ncbi:hypothetical protein [Trebonia kvetii]|nr:hypothetical protein [Trebonia kvetii]
MVSNEDGTPQAITISPAAGLTIRNGSTGNLAVSLPCKPSQNVTVKTTIIDGSGAMTISAGASLTFTTANWNTPQNVTFQSVAAQAGWQRVLVAPFGADAPGYSAVTAHILVS